MKNDISVLSEIVTALRLAREANADLPMKIDARIEIDPAPCIVFEAIRGCWHSQKRVPIYEFQFVSFDLAKLTLEFIVKQLRHNTGEEKA